MKVKLAHLGVGKGGQSSPNVFVEDRRQQAALSLSLSLASVNILSFYGWANNRKDSWVSGLSRNSPHHAGSSLVRVGRTKWPVLAS